MALTKLRFRLLLSGEYQYVIAAKARVSPARLSQYANGKRKIPATNLARIAVVLGCEPSELVGLVSDEDHYVT